MNKREKRVEGRRGENVIFFFSFFIIIKRVHVNGLNWCPATTPADRKSPRWAIYKHTQAPSVFFSLSLEASAEKCVTRSTCHWPCSTFMAPFALSGRSPFPLTQKRSQRPTQQRLYFHLSPTHTHTHTLKKNFN